MGYAGEDWWNPQGPYRTLHHLISLRMAWMLPFLARHPLFCHGSTLPLQNMRILDVGCGGGLMAESLASLGAQVTGIDEDSHAIQCAENHCLLKNYSIAYHGINFLKAHPVLKEKKFDVLCALDVLEHDNSPGPFIQQAHRFLSSKGIFLGATLTRTPLSYVKAILLGEYVLGWIPRGTHHWKNFITPTELLSFLNKEGFKEIHFQGFSYHPIQHDWVLTPDITANYFFFANKEGQES